MSQRTVRARSHNTDSDGLSPSAGSPIMVHLYKACPVDNMDEFAVGDANTNEMDNGVAATLFELPNRTLDGVWETYVTCSFSLVFSDDIKPRLLHYIYTTMRFAALGVDSNIISCNRMVLLHGPPGTGKTTLCRALAQKLAIRLQGNYTHGKLIEINSHSLFSKWFSESGKLVHRLFDMVLELLKDRSGFVVVLIDEVESLTKARASAAAGVEPSDAIRVVNALLTELDKIRKHPNVLVMTTSNLSESIDPAFLDRVDFLQYIGSPGVEASYRILRSCMEELMRVKLVKQERLTDYPQAQDGLAGSQSLFHFAEKCSGASGRMLRRLPLVVYARRYYSAPVASVAEWVKAMEPIWAEMLREEAKPSS